ncbi:Fanconi anemia group I protein [Hyalella azteca]|uniref:Fanconi anemia group I protein n=1 Tax=Hyalella azteca TaxID=294128 RepID=A0A8B7PF70_HYAAZ|nr:Fanconi anemia group I protein [Hyalella azteca]
MLKKYQLLIKKEDYSNLENLLIQDSDQHVIKILSQELKEPHGVSLADGLLTALKGVTRESLSLRTKVYETLFELVRVESSDTGATINEHVLGGLTGVLLRQLDQFPTHCLLPFVDQYIELAKLGEPLHGRWLDILPKLVCTISKRQDIILGGTREMTGEDFKYHVIQTFCEQTWPATTTSSLLVAFKEMNLEKQELTDIVLKVERVLRSLEYQNVPPIIYQLVLLTQSKIPGAAIRTVEAYFREQEKKMLAEQPQPIASMDEINSAEVTDQQINTDRAQRDLREAQGTVILHVTHLAQFDPSIAKDYIKLLKTARWLPHVLFSPFNLSLALSLASIERYQDQVVEAVCKSIHHSLLLAQKSRHSAWLRRVWPLAVDLQNVLRTTIVNSAQGWQQVCSGVCVVLLSLLEGGAGVRDEAASLGVTCLPLLLSSHPQTAPHCLKQIANCSLIASRPRHYLAALSRIGRCSPMVLVEHQSLVRELLLEQLQHHQPATAVSILHALSNTFRMDVPLRDALMLTLRKMLFSRTVHCRVVAVQGLLLLLRHLRVETTLSSSQASFSFSSALSQISATAAQVHGSDLGQHESLCYELLALLRRCFSQQHEVRSALYKGLYDVCRANRKLTVNILGLLLQHLSAFIDTRPACLNPIVVKDLVTLQGDSWILQEPLGDLLSVIAACKVFYRELEENPAHSKSLLDDDEDDANSPEILNDVCRTFDVLEQKLSTCELNDLDFDNNTDFSLSALGQKNQLLAQIMFSVYDAVIGHTFLCDVSRPKEKMQLCVDLFKKQRKIVELVKVKSAKSTASKKGEGTSKGKGRVSSKNEVDFKSILRLSVVTEMLALCLCEGEGEQTDLPFAECQELQAYLLSCVESHVSAHSNLSIQERDRHLPYLRRLARLLFVECFELCGRVDPDDEREVAKLHTCVNIVHSLMDNFVKHHGDKLEQILKDITNKSASNDVNTLAFLVVKGCQKMLVRLLGIEDNQALMKDSTTIVQIIAQVVCIINHDAEELQKAYEWVEKFSKEKSIGYVPLCEAIMKLLLFLSDQINARHNLDQHLARDIYHCLGDNDESVIVSDTRIEFSIISESTVTGSISVLMAHLDSSLAITEMSLNKMRAHLCTPTDYPSDKVEENVNIKLGVIIKAMNEVVRSALPLGPVMDLVIKKAEKIYGIMALYIRYYLDLFRVKNYPQISEKFERLVHMSGELLSEPLYLFLNYVEEARSGDRNIALQTAMKESKLIPALVFAIEKYEKLVIQLSKRSKVNLMTGMKLSTLRDFKIETNKLERLNNSNDDQEEREDAEEHAPASSDEKTIPKKRKASADPNNASQKRRKLQSK